MYFLDQTFLMSINYNSDNLLKEIQNIDDCYDNWLWRFDPRTYSYQNIDKHKFCQILKQGTIFNGPITKIEYLAPRGYSILGLIGGVDELIDIHLAACILAVQNVLTKLKQLLLRQYPLFDVNSISIVFWRQEFYCDTPSLRLSFAIARSIKEISGDNIVFEQEIFHDILEESWLIFNKHMYDKLLMQNYKLRLIDSSCMRFELEQFDEIKLHKLQEQLTLHRSRVYPC